MYIQCIIASDFSNNNNNNNDDDDDNVLNAYVVAPLKIKITTFFFIKIFF